MSAAIFSNTNIKLLKRDLLFSEAGTDYAGVLMRPGVDPTSTSTAGNPGSMLVDTTNGLVYLKLDSGSSTNWKRITPHGTHRLSFIEQGNAPILTIENNMSVYLFESGLAQELYAEYTVPNDYNAGRPIVVKARAYCASTSGNILLRAQATLIRSATDDIASTTNQRTTTNSAITMDANNDNEIQVIEQDITSSSGQINSVSLAANDTIVIRIYRDTDTASGDIKFLSRQCEVIVK